MEQYAKYKDSGIDWLGYIPYSWETRKIKYMFEIVKRPYYLEDRQVLSITQRGLRIKNVEKIDGQMAESYSGYQEVNVNDFAMNSMDLLTGWVDCSSFEGVTSPDYRVFRFFPMQPQCHDYYKYIFQICYKNRIFYRLGQGVSNLGRWRLQADQFLNMKLPKPPIQEQETIAIYLESRTADIDILLGELQMQAEMFESYKREVIVETIIHGLFDGDSKRDSGVTWIGRIPANWDIVALRAVAKENTVKNAGMKCENLLSLSYGIIIKKDINTTFGLLPDNFESYQIVQPGYVILRLTDLQNDKRSLRTGYVSEMGIITSAYTGLIPSGQVDNKFFAYLLHAYDLKKIYYSLGGGVRQSLKYSDLKSLPILVPPMQEQKAIVAYIDIKTAQINDLITDINEQIDKLKQYRQIVIHDAVTGKIRVTEG